MEKFHLPTAKTNTKKIVKSFILAAGEFQAEFVLYFQVFIGVPFVPFVTLNWRVNEARY